MQPHAAFMPRNSVSQGVRRILPALVLALIAFPFSPRPGLAEDQSDTKSLLNNFRYILGPIEVHLVFTDSDGKQQDYSLAGAPPEFLEKLPLPLREESKFPLLQPDVRYFDGLWLANKDTVCKEVVTGIQQDWPAGSKNEAYDPSCRPFKYGFMSAYIQPKAPAYFKHYDSQGEEVIPAGGYPTGTVSQLQLEFSVPAVNIFRYNLTTPCTCHNTHNVLGVTTCNQDPDFTGFFDVMIVVRANSTELDSMHFGPRPQMQSGYLVEQTALVIKDGKEIEAKVAGLEATIERQLEIDAVSVAATGEFGVVTIIAQFVEDLFKYGIGGLFEMSCNADLFHSVSTGLSETYNSPAALQMSNTLDQAFKTLFVALDSANAVGFTQLDIVQGPKRSLQFRLTYPTVKPQLRNTIAAANEGIHLSPPSIDTAVQQVKPGLPVLVHGNNFPLPSANALDIAWNRTVTGIAKTQLQWGPKGGTMQTVPVALDTFRAAPLNPSTAYQFRVQQCDNIACSPWSDWLEASTRASGSNDVKVWLDSDAAHPIGNGVVAPNGAFDVSATIPAGTLSGNHTINAATQGDNPEASVDIAVCGAGGCGPSISVMNSQSETAMKPPINLLYPSTFTLRGNGFAPSVTVTLYLDTPSGTPLGTAVPNSAGIFQGSFQMPSTQTGTHSIVAVQVVQGHTAQATEQVDLAAQPR